MMKTRRNICVFLILAGFVFISCSVDARPQDTGRDAGDGAKTSTKTQNVTTTSAPPSNATTKPPPLTTTTPSNASTPSTTPITTTTTIPPSTSTPNSTTTTPTPPTTPTTSPVIPTVPSTTPTPPQPKPDRSFDLPSFVGGIILALGILAIGYVVYKFYRARTDPNYRTL